MRRLLYAAQMADRPPNMFPARPPTTLLQWHEMTAGTADQVDTNVYVGGYLAAANEAYIAQEGITKIVKLFADDDTYPGGATRLKGVEYLVIPAEDTPEYDICPGAYEAVKFIQQCIKSGEKVLVHCHAGVSRSPTVVIFHLMINRGIPFTLAFARLRLVRPFANPNVGFRRHLEATDARLGRLRVGDEKQYVAPPPILAYENSRRQAQAQAHARRASPPPGP